MDLAQHGQPVFLDHPQAKGCILLFHGFTSTTSSVLEWGRYLHRLGFAVDIPCLPGHAGRWRDLNKISYRQWLDTVQSHYREVADKYARVFTAGLSMGGALALYVCEQFPGTAGCAVVNNAVFLNHPLDAVLVPILKHVVSAVKATGGDIKDPTQKEWAYEKTPLAGTHEFLKLIGLVKKDFSKVTAPLLIFKSYDDHVISVKSAAYTYDHVASARKELVWLDNSYHVATVDFDLDKICAKSGEFFLSLTHY